MDYLDKGFVQTYRDEFDGIVRKLKVKRGSGWSFHHYLVGSASRNLVLDSSEGFDLDYHFQMNKWPNNLTDEQVKTKLMEALNSVKPRKLSYCEDSTHVITMNHIINGKKIYSFDIGIVKKSESVLILKNEKQNNGNGPYHFVETPSSTTFYSRYKMIKGVKMWEELRKRYKKKKIDQHKIKKELRPLSFSLLISATNETLQKYGKI